MMEPRLEYQLGLLADILRRSQRSRAHALCWAAAAILGLVLLLFQFAFGWQPYHFVWLAPLIAAMLLSSVVSFRRKSQADEIPGLIAMIARTQPEVRHLLSAAAEQRSSDGTYRLSFLQMRVVDAALAHPDQGIWRKQLKHRLKVARKWQACALLALAGVSLAMTQSPAPNAPRIGTLFGKEITVTPGDTQIERGTGLVVAARFGGAPPAEATLVLNTIGGKELRIPMARRLADPVFGASVPEISEAGVYRVEYRGKKTRDYKITVFEFPALVRADAEVRYPVYTGLTNRVIRDTLRVSAVTGARLNYTLLLNKPVARARWVGKDQSLTLIAGSNAVARLPDFLLTNSARYSLELTDSDGRSNKFPTDFVLVALTNQPAAVKLVFPRGDKRVSRLEELQLEAEASDDFGLLKYGIGYGVAGLEPRMVELGQAAPANAKRQFSYLIALEKMNLEVDQAVAYFAWADDYGPDGQPRRAFSDIYFAEVRPFDEIFRQDQSGEGESGNQQSAGQQGGGNQRVRLANLQKQIVVATWNLQRETPGAASLPKP